MQFAFDLGKRCEAVMQKPLRFWLVSYGQKNKILVKYKITTRCAANFVHPTTLKFQCDSMCKTFCARYDLENRIGYVKSKLTPWHDMKKKRI